VRLAGADDDQRAGGPVKGGDSAGGHRAEKGGPISRATRVSAASSPNIVAGCPASTQLPLAEARIASSPTTPRPTLPNGRARWCGAVTRSLDCNSGDEIGKKTRQLTGLHVTLDYVLI
jgi:hypothetical protein